MIVGIDLGTTHSLIGRYGSDGPQLFRNALGETLTPSVVSVDDAGTLLVGQAAKERLVSHPHRSVATFKRWMGTARDTVIGSHRFRPEELSAMVLKSLIADAEAATGEKIAQAVISVPAYFSDSQRKATKAAGELAGIRVERLVNEPTAAALAYGLEARPDGSRFLVFDLGGGTFDVSIMEMFDGVMEVHASAGDNYLGGEDFTAAMRADCLRAWEVDPKRVAAAEDAQLLRRLEIAKRQLGTAGEARVSASLDGKDRVWDVDAARFDRICEPLVQRLRDPLERAMRDARLVPAQLDEIILVGGGSRMPLASRLVSRMFGRLPLRHVDPDQAIALGACVAAGMKARDQSLREVVLTDVCPYTLGVATSRDAGNGQLISGLFSPIIQRNSAVPVSRMEIFAPIHDWQKEVELEIYQGESPRVEHNVRLGKMLVPVQGKRREDKRIEVRFTYDVNGLLQVEATVLASGITHEVVLEENPGTLSAAEIRQRLERLAGIKIHPRDHQENLVVVARAERLYAEVLWARDDLQSALTRFRAVVESQDTEAIARHRVDFSTMLDRLEHDA